MADGESVAQHRNVPGKAGKSSQRERHQDAETQSK
jgi:hypothetical protein